MAEVAFHYQPTSGVLQKIDARIKLLSVFMVSIITFSSHTPGLTVVTLFVILCFFLARIRVRYVLRELKLFLIFALIIVATSSLNIGAPSLVSSTGLKQGLLVSWRFIDLILLGVLFTASASILEIRRGTEAILSWVPGVNGRKVAFMVSATVSMLPLISDAAEEMRLAQRARYGDRRLNPVRKIVTLVFPLMLKIFRATDEMAQAMQARALDLNKPGTQKTLHLGKRDILALLVTVTVSAMAVTVGWFF